MKVRVSSEEQEERDVRSKGAREVVSADHLAFETRAHDRSDSLCAYLVLAPCHILPNLTFSLRVLLSPPPSSRAPLSVSKPAVGSGSRPIRSIFFDRAFPEIQLLFVVVISASGRLGHGTDVAVAVT